MKKKKGVKKKFVGGLLGRRAARQRAKEEGLTGKELRKAGRQGFMSGTGLGRIAGAVQGFRANKGMGFKERLREPLQGLLVVLTTEQMQVLLNVSNQVTETDLMPCKIQK